LDSSSPIETDEFVVEPANSGPCGRPRRPGRCCGVGSRGLRRRAGLSAPSAAPEWGWV